MNFRALALASVATFSLLAFTACDSGDSSSPSTAPATPGGGTSPSGNYQSSCAALSGSTFGATYSEVNASFSGSTYSFSTYFFTDSACHSEVYVISTSGTYAMGSSVAQPQGGYGISFTPTSQSLTSYAGSSSSAINTACGTSLAGSGTTTVILSGGLNCSGGAIGLVANSTVSYNAFVLSGVTLSLGSRTMTNPGVGSQGLVATSTNLNLTGY